MTENIQDYYDEEEQQEEEQEDSSQSYYEQNAMECFSKGGFTFCNVDCSELNLLYVPDNANTYVYRPAKYDVHEQKFDGHDGGYFYGTTTQPKEFKLRCVYQNEHVNNGSMTQILSFYKRGRTGRLVFEKRPWVWYNATVTDIDVSQMTNYRNGFVTITMKAYYPFGRSDIAFIPDELPESYPYNPIDIKANSAIMVGMQWDTDQDFAESENITQQKDVLLYNPGTERASVAIKIKGNMTNGVTIYNQQTKQICEIIGLNTTEGDHADKTLIIDSLSGKVLLQSDDGQNVEYAFLYHDKGFIDLDPAYPAIRDIYLEGATGSNVVTTDYVFTSDDIGKYIGFETVGGTATLNYGILGQLLIGDDVENQMQAMIVGVSDDGKTLTLNKSLGDVVAGYTDVVFYNHLVVTPASGSSITSLVFDYKPTFS